jgi:hypothetical protein
MPIDSNKLQEGIATYIHGWDGVACNQKVAESVLSFTYVP